MKHLFLLFFLCIVFASYGQNNDTTKYYKDPNYGAQVKRSKVDSILQLPNGVVINRSYVFPGGSTDTTNRNTGLKTIFRATQDSATLAAAINAKPSFRDVRDVVSDSLKNLQKDSLINRVPQFDYAKNIFGTEYLIALHQRIADNRRVKIFVGGTSQIALQEPSNSPVNVVTALKFRDGYSDSITLENYAVSGSNAQDFLNNRMGIINSGGYSCIVISHEINDGARGTLATRLNLFDSTMSLILNSLRNGGYGISAGRSVDSLSIVLMTSSATNDTIYDRDSAWYIQANLVLRNLARKYKCAFIDTWNAFNDANSTWMDAPFAPGSPNIGIHPRPVANRWIGGMLYDCLFPKGLQTYALQTVKLNQNNYFTKAQTMDLGPGTGTAQFAWRMFTTAQTGGSDGVKISMGTAGAASLSAEIFARRTGGSFATNMVLGVNTGGSTTAIADALILESTLNTRFVGSPYTSNSAIPLGTSTLRWANVFSILGNYSARLRASSLMLNKDSVAFATSASKLMLIDTATGLLTRANIGTGLTLASGQLYGNTSIVATATNDAATAGHLGENIESNVSTFTNYSTTATYQNVTSITLTAGDWDISASGTFNTNTATLTGASNAIFVVSTATASDAGSTLGKNIMYIPQASLLGTSIQSTSSVNYRVNLSGTTTFYLNTQATFTLGNPKYTGFIRARRMR